MAPRDLDCSNEQGQGAPRYENRCYAMTIEHEMMEKIANITVMQLEGKLMEGVGGAPLLAQAC